MREDIDKMHAYRDAIGQVTGTDFQRILKSAIVLFPSPADPAYHTHAFYTSLPPRHRRSAALTQRRKNRIRSAGIPRGMRFENEEGD